MSFHGTYDGRFFDVELPIDSSMYRFSSGEILGCLAGVSKMKMNQHSDQRTPIPPVDFMYENLLHI